MRTFHGLKSNIRRTALDQDQTVNPEKTQVVALLARCAQAQNTAQGLRKRNSEQIQIGTVAAVAILFSAVFSVS